MNTRIAIIGICFFLYIPSAYSDVIQYVDSSGRTHFVDTIEKVPTEYRSQIKKFEGTHSVSKTGTTEYDNKIAAKSVTQTTQKKSVEIFVTSWCGYCKALEADLKKEGITFKKYDIETSEKGRKIYKELGKDGIPVIRVNGKKILTGYSSLDPIKKALRN